ncbi:MAG: FMN-binding protein [Angelakisella sp.]
MKKILAISLAVVMVLSMAACGSTTGTAPEAADKKELTGVGEGFGGLLKVAVTTEGGKITAVTVTENSETPAIGGPALTAIPEAIVKANSADVEVVSGATVTSKAIQYAVKNAMDPTANPAPGAKAEETKPVDAVSTAKAFMGTGVNFSTRMGPGKDDTETPVYSTNQVFANAIFDDAGKILHLNIDQLEVATPNYDGDGMPHFSGFPGQGGYNFDDNHDGKIDGKKTGGTEDEFVAEVAAWKTKRERGDAYKMGTGTWSAQMDAFQKLFVGKTPEEVKAWAAKYCSDLNGRPLKITEKSKDEDKAKFDKLTDAEKADLAELTSSATMSLNDSHGDILSAIVKSFDNKVAIDLTIG